MSTHYWCHGTNCHKSRTQDRVRGSKGSKVLRTRKVKQNQWNQDSFFKYFCSNGCYNDFANTYVSEVIALHPRTEALETPIDVVKEPTTDWRGNPYMMTKIKEIVDNNGG